MARYVGQEAAAVILDDLLNHGHRYSLLQAYRLLLQVGGPETRIELEPALGLDSARSVIERIEQLDDGYFRIELNIFNLYGRNGVLPAYMTDYLLASEQQEKGQARAFLNLLNRRIYQILIQAQQRSMQVFQGQSELNQGFYDRLRALAGLMDADQEPDGGLLRYFRLLSSPYRSAAGLEVLLENFLEGVSVEAIQCEIRQVSLPRSTHLKLGQQSAGLGEGSLLGSRLPEATGSFVLRIGPMAYNRFDQLLSDSRQWQQLRELIRLYLRQPLRCELEFLLDCTGMEQKNSGSSSVDGLIGADHSNTANGSGLNGWGRLGQNAWLLRPDFTAVDGSSYQLQARIALD